jgi:hypothetical protein
VQTTAGWNQRQCSSYLVCFGHNAWRVTIVLIRFCWLTRFEF